MRGTARKTGLSGVRQALRWPGTAAVQVTMFPDAELERELPVPAELVTGGQRLIRVREGLGVVISFGVVGPRGMVAQSAHPGLVHFHFNMDGAPAGWRVDGVARDQGTGDGAAHVMSPASAETGIFPPGTLVRMVSPLLDPTEMDELLAFAGVRLDRSTARFMGGTAGSPPVLPGRMAAEARPILARILTCPLQGGLKRLYIEGAVLELLAARLASLPGVYTAEIRASTGRRVRDRLHQVREILLNRLSAPTTLSDLSRESGLSVAQIKRGFPALFGETVFGYARSLRLDRAAYLLREHGISVKEAAHIAGYASASRFAQAFRARTGRNPHDWVHGPKPS